MPYLRIVSVANISFNSTRENKILVKISEFTVLHLHSYLYFSVKL